MAIIEMKLQNKCPRVAMLSHCLCIGVGLQVMDAIWLFAVTVALAEVELYSNRLRHSGQMDHFFS